MNQINKNVGIKGVGSYVPEKILSNTDLEKMVDTSDEWIRTRTGIEERRIAGDEISTSDMAVNAAQKALDDAGIEAKEIDLIIVATLTADMYTPSTACIVQERLGAVKAAAFDLNSACTGFIYGLSVGSQFILTGHYKNVLVIGADKLSAITDWKDRNTCVLFGDGAGAAVLGVVDDGNGILATHLGADGSMGGTLTAPSCLITEEEKSKRLSENFRTIRMQGSEVFKFAVKVMANETTSALEKLDIPLSEVDLIVPHQANIRIIDAAAKKLGIMPEKLYTNLNKYGNMAAASVPVALDEAVKDGRLKKGDLLVLVGFGGGLTWGSSIIRWSK